MIVEQMVTGIAETVLEDIETLEGIDTGAYCPCMVNQYIVRRYRNP